MRARPISLVLLAVVLVVNNAATTEDQLTPLQLVDKASDFFSRAMFDSAIATYREAEVQLRASKEWKSLAACHTSIAEVYRTINNTESSTAWLDSAYNVIRQQGLTNTEELAKALEINGRVLDYNLRQFDKAEVLYDSSLRIRRGLFGNEHLSISENIYLIGRTYFLRARLEDASKNFLEAVNMKLRLGGENEMSLFDPYQSLGALNRRQLKMDKSLEYYKKAEAVWDNNHRPKDHPSFGMMVYGLGNLNIETGMYEDAKQNYRDAASTFEKFFGPKDFRTASAYSNVGACYRNQLEYAEAELHYSRARSIYEEVLPENHPFITSSYADLADMYHAAGNDEESAKFSALAIGLIEKYQPGTRELALASFYYAATLADLRQLGEAKKRITTAISILSKMDELYLLSNAWTVSGEIHHLMNDNETAEKHYVQAIALFGENPSRTLQLGYNIGAYAKFKKETGDPAEALKLFDQSMFHLNTNIDPDGTIHALNDFQNVDFLIGVLPDRGDAQLALFEQSGDQSVLTKAYNNYIFLTELYERVIKESKSERSKLLQIPNLATYYEKAVACALRLGETTGDPAWRERAFAFSEQSKSIILWQYVHDSRSREFVGIPLNVTSEERRLKEKLRFLEKSIGDTADDTDTAVVKLKASHFALRTTYDSLVRKIETDYPAYYTLKYQRPEVSVSKLQEQIGENEAILEYLAGDEYVYTFLISKDTLNVWSFKNDGQLVDIAGNIRSGLIAMDQGRFMDSGTKFYDNFFKPVAEALRKSNINSVTVIPDGLISYIPFDALPLGDSKYLIQEFTFHYHYSAGLMSTYDDVAKENSNADFIGFAPAFDGSNELSSLNFTKEEVGEINNLLGGRSLTDSEATESNFKKLVGEYGIVHVATHAVMDDDDADHSRLHFSSADSIDDGRLHAWELFNMKIPASLVTLSACNTGDGRLHKGEGVMSLSRAFAYAGCPSIVTSLWQAQDQSTAKLMRNFYEFLAEGQGKAEALRLAKLKYLETSDKVKSLPFFWAGFILVGDDMPLPKSYSMWWITGGLTLSLVLAGFAMYRRRG
jgi:CHAT domain-containing protein